MVNDDFKKQGTAWHSFYNKVMLLRGIIPIKFCEVTKISSVMYVYVYKTAINVRYRLKLICGWLSEGSFYIYLLGLFLCWNLTPGKTSYSAAQGYLFLFTTKNK